MWKKCRKIHLKSGSRLRDHKISNQSMFVFMHRMLLTLENPQCFEYYSIRPQIRRYSYLKWIDTGVTRLFPVPACTKCLYRFIYRNRTWTTINSKQCMRFIIIYLLFVSTVWCWFSIWILFLVERSCAYLRFIKIHSIFITIFFSLSFSFISTGEWND